VARNTAEGGTNGVTVTTANSGGASGDAFDTPVISATCTLTFDNTHPAHGSGLSYKFQLGGTAGECYLPWTTQFTLKDVPQVSYHIKGAYFGANPGATIYLFRVANAAGTNTFGLGLDTAGKLLIKDGGGTIVATMATAIPLNTLFDIDVDALVVGSTGTIQIRRTDVADSGQPTDQLNGTVTAAVGMGRIRWGHTGTGVATVGPWWYDDLEATLPDGVILSPDTFLPDASLLIQTDDNGDPTLGWLYQPPWYQVLADAGIATQELDPLGIDASAAPGLSTLSPGAVALSPGPAAPTDAAGLAVLAQTLSPGGISTGEMPGQTALASSLAPGSIASGETAGQPVLTPGAVSLAAGAVPSGEVLGASTLAAAAASVNPGGISSGEVLGAVALSPGGVTLAPGAVPSGEALGSPALAQVFTPGGIATSAALGAAQLVPTLAPGAVSSGQILGAAVLTPGAVTLSPAGIISAEQAGPASLTTAALLTPGGITSAEAVGQTTLTPGAVALSPGGVISAEVFGQGAFTLALTPPGIRSSELAGLAALVATLLTPAGIGTGEQLGQAALIPGAVTLSPAGIGSEARLGASSLAITTIQTLSPAGITSAQAVGLATITVLTDITVIGHLEPRRWTARLGPRRFLTDSELARWAGAISGRTKTGTLPPRRWEAELERT
jgi:hypothetical protein